MAFSSYSPPVVVFAYKRLDSVRGLLEALFSDGARKFVVFSDAPKTASDAASVAAVRDYLRSLDWEGLTIVEREANLGLGQSILQGMTDVFRDHEAAIVLEDDLKVSPGFYGWMSAALERYRDDHAVLSVTGWTHPDVTPKALDARPYFDGRAECWSWGAWRRSWQGMEGSALELLKVAFMNGADPAAWGADLLEMALAEQRRNLWAVRWSYLHIANQGLCLRPPQSLVDHAGDDGLGTNVSGGQNRWRTPLAAPPAPSWFEWPEPRLHPECPILWRSALGEPSAEAARALELLNFCRHEEQIRRDLEAVYEARFRRDWLSGSPDLPHYTHGRHRISSWLERGAPGDLDSLARAFYSAEMVREGDTVLDIGCGDGFATRAFLAPKAARVDALDIEGLAIAEATWSNSAPNVSYWCRNAITEDFPQTDAAYDVIVWDGAIGHFPKEGIFKVLEKISRSLKPDGVFCGSESLGREEGHDHLTFFDDAGALAAILRPFFGTVYCTEKSYVIGNGFRRREGYWRCWRSAQATPAGFWQRM